MVLRTLVALLLLLCLGGSLSADQDSSFDSLYYSEFKPIHDFSLTNQNGQTVRLEDLRGKVWIASFFFSTCPDCAGKHIPQLKRLQEKFGNNSDLMIISFSVNPQQDTPSQLAEFAKSMGADPQRWQFLTGPEQTIYSLSQESFQQGVARNQEATDGREVTHSFRLLLVDHRGKIKGYIDGTDPQEVDRLAVRANLLVQAKYFPSLNASLNGLAGLLLILGFLAVRKHWITLHKFSMLTALAVSAVFLGCYLYYHFVVLRGESTRFGGEGWIRIVYFSILLSHTLLAVVVAPLALISTYLGIRNRISSHKNIARWTLPLWLYVSITGVVVYLLLYQIYSPL